MAAPKNTTTEKWCFSLYTGSLSYLLNLTLGEAHKAGTTKMLLPPALWYEGY